MDKARQQRQNGKARKAKTRAAAKAQHRSWIDRRKDRLAASSRATATLSSVFAASAAMTAALSSRPSGISERMLCEVLGEEYRP